MNDDYPLTTAGAIQHIYRGGIVASSADDVWLMRYDVTDPVNDGNLTAVKRGFWDKVNGIWVDAPIDQQHVTCAEIEGMWRVFDPPANEYDLELEEAMSLVREENAVVQPERDPNMALRRVKYDGMVGLELVSPSYLGSSKFGGWVVRADQRISIHVAAGKWRRHPSDRP